MASTKSTVLAINGGSSSIKFALFESDESPVRTWGGKVDGVGQPEGHFSVNGPNDADNISEVLALPDYADAVTRLMDCVRPRIDAGEVSAVGHRVVHGGAQYREAQRITPPMIEELRQLSPFDPEHLPEELLLIEAVQRGFPDVPQIACFDTEFHRDMPRVAVLLPIPRRYEAKGVQRYGFHGLSYAYLLQELERLAGPMAANACVILAHLGNGASMTALRDGHCVDTTMAFTPASGLVMSTRSGDVDPGLVAFLARSEQMTAVQFSRMTNHESGLLGISETSSDMRDLLARESIDVRAAEAIALFCYQVKKSVGAYAAALGGLDTLVFSGGIGESAAPIRARACEGLGFLGIELDESRNAAHAGLISTDASRVTVRVIPTDEELMIAESVFRILNAGLNEGR